MTRQRRLPHLKPIDDILVLGGVDLDPALDEIEGDDGRVSDATWQDAADAAEGVILGAAELAGVLHQAQLITSSLLIALTFYNWLNMSDLKGIHTLVS